MNRWAGQPFGRLIPNYSPKEGGLPTHPVWYLNLEAQPACQLMVGAKAVSARARVAEGEERERIWAQMAEIYPPYLDYEKATTRKIPVVVLDPV